MCNTGRGSVIQCKTTTGGGGGIATEGWELLLQEEPPVKRDTFLKNRQEEELLRDESHEDHPMKDQLKDKPREKSLNEPYKKDTRETNLDDIYSQTST